MELKHLGIGGCLSVLDEPTVEDALRHRTRFVHQFDGSERLNCARASSQFSPMAPALESALTWQ
jgi:hypothetical protein